MANCELCLNVYDLPCFPSRGLSLDPLTLALVSQPNVRVPSYISES